MEILILLGFILAFSIGFLYIFFTNVKTNDSKSDNNVNKSSKFTITNNGISAGRDIFINDNIVNFTNSKVGNVNCSVSINGKHIDTSNNSRNENSLKRKINSIDEIKELQHPFESQIIEDFNNGEKLTVDGKNNVNCKNMNSSNNCYKCTALNNCENCYDSRLLNNCDACVSCLHCNNCDNCENVKHMNNQDNIIKKVVMKL